MHNVLKTDMEYYDGLLEEQGMDHCITIGFNFLAGGRVLYSLADTLSLIRKSTNLSQPR